MDTLLYHLWQIFSPNLFCFLIRTNWILLCFPSLGFILKNILTGSLYSSSQIAFKWMWNSDVNVSSYQWASVASVLILTAIFFFSQWEVCHSLKWKRFSLKAVPWIPLQCWVQVLNYFSSFTEGINTTIIFFGSPLQMVFLLLFNTEDLVRYWKHWYYFFFNSKSCHNTSLVQVSNGCFIQTMSSIS